MICELLRRSQTRINLLFTMSEIPHACPVRDATCEVMFRGRLFGGHLFRGTLSIFNSIWWSQTGSNRRPHACKARALPAELWPRTRRRMFACYMRSACRAEARANQSVYALSGFGVTAFLARASKGWWAWEDLNFRPHAYQARALTN